MLTELEKETIVVGTLWTTSASHQRIGSIVRVFLSEQETMSDKQHSGKVLVDLQWYYI